MPAKSTSKIKVQERAQAASGAVRAGGEEKSSTSSPPKIGSRPNTVSRDGKKAIWVVPIGPGGMFGN